MNQGLMFKDRPTTRVLTHNENSSRNVWPTNQQHLNTELKILLSIKWVKVGYIFKHLEIGMGFHIFVLLISTRVLGSRYCDSHFKDAKTISLMWQSWCTHWGLLTSQFTTFTLHLVFQCENAHRGWWWLEVYEWKHLKWGGVLPSLLRCLDPRVGVVITVPGKFSLPPKHHHLWLLSLLLNK